MNTAHEANRRYFREAYRTGEHGWEVESPSRFAVEFLKKVRRQASAQTMLDIGCGEGRHCIAASQLGFKVTGVDYEPLALRRAARFSRDQAAKDIRFRRANVFALPFADASFDVVLDYGCLHHQKKADWLQYLHSVLRVLKPQGFYILSVFTPEFRLFRQTRRPWHIAKGAYRRCFMRREIHNLFGPYFEIVEMIQEYRPGGFWHVLLKRRPESGVSIKTRSPEKLRRMGLRRKKRGMPAGTPHGCKVRPAYQALGAAAALAASSSIAVVTDLGRSIG
jgi:SAM-dependent methyltransferase